MRTTRWLGWRRAAVAGLPRRIADFAGVLFLTGLLVGGSCTSNDKTKGPTFPSDTVGARTATAIAALTIAANPATLQCGQTSTIVVTVLTVNGAPVEGVVVVFNTEAGTLSALTATTDSAGQATVIFRSGNVKTCIDPTTASGASEAVTIAAATADFAGTPVSTDVTVVKP